MFKNLLSKILSDKKQKIIFFGIILLFLITVANVYIANARKILKSKAPPASSATLSLSPQFLTAYETYEFSVEIFLETEKGAVDAVDAILTYDPNYLEVQSLAPGIIFSSYPVSSFGEGKIQLSGFVVDPKKKPQYFSGRGIFGTIAFKALKPVELTKIEFSPDSVAAVGGENVLSKTSGSEILIKALKK